MTELILIVLSVMIVGLQLFSMRRTRQSDPAIASLQKETVKTAHTADLLLQQMAAIKKEQDLSGQSLTWVLESVDAISRTMTKAKSRGIWGEYQMELLLEAYAGKAGKIWDRQVTLANGKTADAAVLLPGSKQILCIDAKFPADNFLEAQEDRDAARTFRKNIKKHIDDVSSKYITQQTAPEAILFLPSEAIFQYVLEEEDSLYQYALDKHVLLCGPGTLTGMLVMLAKVQQDWYRAENMAQIEQGLKKLEKDVQTLAGRLEKEEQLFAALHTRIHETAVSASKVCRDIEDITGDSL